MSASYRSNTTAIRADVRTRASMAVRFMLDDIQRVSNPKTPKDTGQLRQNVLKQVLGTSGTIQWRQKYAKYQEGKQYRNYSTPGTGSGFAEGAVMYVVKRSSEHFRRAGITGNIRARRI